MSKYSEIADIIRDEIRSGVYSEAGKLPTEYELVSRFGVSRQTIRQAIASLKNDGTVYQVQGSGTYISKKSKAKRADKDYNSILVICSYISDYIFPSIIRGIESEFSGGEYRMHLAATGNRVDVERRIPNNVISDADVDGIIVEGTKTGIPNPNVPLYNRIKEMGIPMVFIHCTYPELSNAVVVGMDDYAGGRIAAKALVDQGCRILGGIFKSDDRQGLQRYSGFVDGAMDNKIGLESIHTRWYTTEDISDQDDYVSREQLAAFADDGIEGVVCYNDQVALAIARDYAKYGMEVPKLFSFDHSYLCNVTSIESLGHRKEELGRIAAKKVKNMIAGQEETSVYLDWIPVKG